MCVCVGGGVVRWVCVRKTAFTFIFFIAIENQISLFGSGIISLALLVATLFFFNFNRKSASASDKIRKAVLLLFRVYWNCSMAATLSLNETFNAYSICASNKPLFVQRSNVLRFIYIRIICCALHRDTLIRIVSQWK